MLHFTKKRAVIGAAVVTLAMGAVAFAFFTSTGTGSGSASVGTSTDWAVTTDPATGGPLYPGAPATGDQTVAYHVKNNSAGHQKLFNVAIRVANANGSPWTAGTTGPLCSKDDFQISGAVAGATQTDTPNVNLAPGATYDGSVTIHMIDNDANQDNCKNATVSLHLAAS